MSRPIIEVSGLAKRYRLGTLGAKTFRDEIQDAWVQWQSRKDGKPGKQSNGTAEPISGARSSDEFWALQDVSFSVQRGEVLGIIGRNGAGKSTLLKILSRITEPTLGEVVMRGRVASLLEVGTGFHPELSGRENIFLNGAILGMKKAEIARKFDEIVDFAEIEKFIDTPVKRYSSGMYVRLAFAVAAHLEPEILIVDEVLAVGDAQFQKKCLGKMQEVSRKDGRTILLVSHTMPAVLRLCSQAILLANGRVTCAGKPETVANVYANPAAQDVAEHIWPDDSSAPGDHIARLRSVRVLDAQGALTDSVEIHEPCYLEIEYRSLVQGQPVRPTAAFHVINDAGVVAFASADFTNTAWRHTAREPGLVRSRCRIPANLLAEGRFTLLAAVVSYNPDLVHAIESDALSFHVIDRTRGDGARGEYAGFAWPGAVRPLLDWEVTLVSLNGGTRSWLPEQQN